MADWRYRNVCIIIIIIIIIMNTCLLTTVSVLCLYSCGSLYRGDYCQYDNPCRHGLNRCINGGRCQVLESISSIGYTCQCPLGKSRPLPVIDHQV